MRGADLFSPLFLTLAILFFLFYIFKAWKRRRAIWLVVFVLFSTLYLLKHFESYQEARMRINILSGTYYLVDSIAGLDKNIKYEVKLNRDCSFTSNLDDEYVCSRNGKWDCEDWNEYIVCWIDANKKSKIQIDLDGNILILKNPIDCTGNSLVEILHFEKVN